MPDAVYLRGELYFGLQELYKGTPKNSSSVEPVIGEGLSSPCLTTTMVDYGSHIGVSLIVIDIQDCLE
jgi:hypothetical protein